MMGTGVYEIINQSTSKKYIGCSMNLTNRKQSHFFELDRNKHANKYLQSSYNKHGKDNFKFNILLFCDKDRLFFYEDKFVDFYGIENLYNIVRVGKNSLQYLSPENDILGKKIRFIISDNNCLVCCTDLAKAIGYSSPTKEVATIMLRNKDRFSGYIYKYKIKIKDNKGNVQKREMSFF